MARRARRLLGPAHARPRTTSARCCWRRPTPSRRGVAGGLARARRQDGRRALAPRHRLPRQLRGGGRRDRRRLRGRSAARPSYKRTIDASEGDSLAETDEYADAVDALEDDRLAHFWVDTAALIELARRPGERPRRSALGARAARRPAADRGLVRGRRRSAGASRSRRAARSSGRCSAAGARRCCRSCPATRGRRSARPTSARRCATRSTASRARSAGSSCGASCSASTGSTSTATCSTGSATSAFFVRGTTPATLDGGVVIQPTDEDRAADAFGRIVGAVQVEAEVRARAGRRRRRRPGVRAQRPRDSPHPIVIARGSGLVVITVGRPAAEAALGSGDRLGDTDLYSEAEELVGHGAERAGLDAGAARARRASARSRVREAEPYLEAYSVVAAGTVVDGDEASAGRAAWSDPRIVRAS